MRGPVAAAPLPPDAVGPGNVEVGAVVLVQRLLHDVVNAERGLEAPDAQAPGRFRGAVFKIGLVNRGLAVLQARRTGCVGSQPELLVGLVGVQSSGHAAAGVPPGAEFTAHAEPGAGAEAVGISGGAASSAGFGGDVAGADVAAGLPSVGGLGAGRRRREAYGQNGASVHVDLHGGWAPGWHMKQAPGATTRLCARARTGILIRIKQTRDLAATQ